MGLIALGVTGGIGAYKSVEIARGLQQAGHDVVAIMTRSAQRFIGRVTFEAITRRPVCTDGFAPGANTDIGHIALADEIDALLVAPATANVIAKFALGIADDFLTTLVLATRAPILLAPAMNSNMLRHVTVSQNLATLRTRGMHVISPGKGYLACGWSGEGRLAEPEDVVSETLSLLRPVSDLAGHCVLVAAGPTYEDLDPVRYIGNRSSGRMGLAVAAEAASRGARVHLVLGPTALEPPVGVEVVRVRSAAEMLKAVMAQAPEADVIIMAAAVADYTLNGGASDQKISKEKSELALTLTRTTDILAELGEWRAERSRPLLVGFAAETKDVVERAAAKLLRKRIDLVVANDVSRKDAGFDVDSNAAVLVEAEGRTELALQSKREIAALILDRVAMRLGADLRGEVDAMEAHDQA